MDVFKDNEILKPKASILNRSMTVHTSANPIESPGKTLYSYSSIERNGSFKKLHSSNPIKGTVKKLCSLFESRKPSNLLPQTPTKPRISSLLGAEDCVVIYFTSLRGIRRTFEDCYTVRMILKSFRVKIDERDLSMDSAYKKELQSVLGEKIVSLPQVFIKGKHIGGAEVIKQLNEIGELSKLLRGLPLRPPGYTCQGCGDVRFLPCSKCNGSRKYFDEDEEPPKRCLECNENGLVRCPLCCS